MKKREREKERESERKTIVHRIVWGFVWKIARVDSPFDSILNRSSNELRKIFLLRYLSLSNKTVA